MCRIRVLAAVGPLLSLLLTSTAAHADGGFPGGRSWAVGLGVATSPSPFIDHQTETLPFPLVVYQGERFRALGAGMSYRLLGSIWGSLDLTAIPRFEGFDPKAGSALDGMKERKGTLELGADLTFGPLSLAVSQDAAGVHQGQEASLSFGVPWHGKRWELISSLGIKWKSANLVDYYYGVRETEANANRPSYEGSSAFALTSDLTLTSQVSWNWLLFASVQGERLPSAITGSPIVEDEYQLSSFVGIIRII